MAHRSVRGFSDHSRNSAEKVRKGGVSKMCTSRSAKVHSLRSSRYLLGVHGRQCSFCRHRMDFPKQKVQLLLSLRLDWDKLVCSWWDCSDVAGLVYPKAAKQRRRGRERPARKFSIGGTFQVREATIWPNHHLQKKGYLTNMQLSTTVKRGANPSLARSSALRGVVTSSRFVK